MLQSTFTSLIIRCKGSQALADTMWRQLHDAYTHSSRHYHTLAHLENMLNWLMPYHTLVADWDTLLFSLFYHDYVYNVLKHNNEEKSADAAARYMADLHLPDAQIGQCSAQIMATQNHEATTDADTNLLTDADLCILGQPWPVYQQYTTQVRAEYAIYPDLLYKPGRRKAMQHFLQQPHIYKTDQFYNSYEVQARSNISREIDTL